MVVGENAIGNTKGRTRSEIKRPLNQTIMLLEVELPTPWMSPEDFSINDFNHAVYVVEKGKAWEIRKAYHAWELQKEYHPEKWDGKPFGQYIIGGAHYRELHVLFADGTVKTYWDYSLPLTELEKMCHIE
jgi:hypothetical protein